MKLLYPFEIDRWNPIQSIHRNLAAQFQPECHVTAFAADGEYRGPVDSLYRVPEPGSWKSLPTFVRAFAREHDVVHTGPSPRHRLARLSALRGAGIVHTIHSADDRDLVLSRQRTMSEQADAVTAVSPFVQSWAREELGIETRVVPNGIDCDRFRPDRAETDPDTALYIGRFVDRKNPSLLPELARELPDVDFLVRGEGDVEIATDPPNLRLLGYLSNDELADLVSRAGALLCPFEREAFGMVLLEAMASGTPIVGLDSGNVPHLLTEDCGVICESLDTDEWVDGLRTALAGEYDPRPVAEDYSWSNVASQYYEIYEAVRRR